ncbi:MAG: hypothetical protein GX876_08010 [Bacteroidales bacterium]|nr:hypothetical protein [Bacteroidales bacterium]
MQNTSLSTIVMKKIMLISSCISLFFVFPYNIRSQEIKQLILTDFSLQSSALCGDSGVSGAGYRL